MTEFSNPRLDVVRITWGLELRELPGGSDINVGVGLVSLKQINFQDDQSNFITVHPEYWTVAFLRRDISELVQKVKSKSQILTGPPYFPKDQKLSK